MRGNQSPKTLPAVLLLLTFLCSTLITLPVTVFANPGGTAWCGHTITTTTTLTANIGPCSGYGIIVAHNGITLNCAGHTITGSAANVKAGVFLNGRTKVTVKNCNVKAFRYGIELVSSPHNTLTSNTASGNHLDGFLLQTSSHDTLASNTANGNVRYGFYILSSTYNTLIKNVADSNHLDGFHFSSSSYNDLGLFAYRFYGNVANFNRRDGFYLRSSSSNDFSWNTANGNVNGYYLDSSSSNTFFGNTADANTPIDYYSSNNAGFYLYSSSWNTLQENLASGDDYGFYLDSSSHNTLGPSSSLYSGNTANDNRWGFFLTNSNSNTLTENTANNNLNGCFDFCYFTDGFFIYGSGNTLTSNTADSNQYCGFSVSNDYNAIVSNTANGNDKCGFDLIGLTNSVVKGNTADGNGGGTASNGQGTPGDGFDIRMNWNNINSSHNAFTMNTANNNDLYGYEDVSVGSGTMGTDNTYSLDGCSSNAFGGSSPSGLCSPQP